MARDAEERILTVLSAVREARTRQLSRALGRSYSATEQVLDELCQAGRLRRDRRPTRSPRRPGAGSGWVYRLVQP